MDFINLGSEIHGKWRLPGTAETDTIDGTIAKDGRFTFLSLSRPFKGRPEAVKELIGTVEGEPGEWKLIVLFNSLQGGSSSSGAMFSVVYIVESLLPVEK